MLTEISGSFYLWIKGFHLVAVISWMAGLLYLPRLFVYHCSAQTGSDKSETFKAMERRLLRVIMTPALIISWFLGSVLLMNAPDGLLEETWLHVKLTGALILTALHIMMARWRKDFADDINERSHKFYRAANEIPTILMVVIVLMAVAKPF